MHTLQKKSQTIKGELQRYEVKEINIFQFNDSIQYQNIAAAPGGKSQTSRTFIRLVYYSHIQTERC